MTKEERRELVYTSNVITMLQDGLMKVLDGDTSFDEIYRIIEIDSDSNENYGIEFSNNDSNNTKDENKKVEENNTKEENETAANVQTTENITNNVEVENKIDETGSEITKEAPKSVLNNVDNNKSEINNDIIIEIPHIPVSLETQNSNSDTIYNEETNNSIDFYSPIDITVETNTAENNTIETPNQNNEAIENEIKYSELSNDEQNIPIPNIQNQNNTIDTNSNNTDDTIVYGKLSNEKTDSENIQENENQTIPQIINSTPV